MSGSPDRRTPLRKAPDDRWRFPKSLAVGQKGLELFRRQVACHLGALAALIAHDRLACERAHDGIDRARVEAHVPQAFLDALTQPLAEFLIVNQHGGAGS